MRLTKSFPTEPQPAAEAAAPDISIAGVPMALISDGGELMDVNQDLVALSGFRSSELRGTPLCLLMKGMSAPGSFPAKGNAQLITKTGHETPVAYTLKRTPRAGSSALTVISRAEEEGLREKLAAMEDDIRRREEYIECFKDGVFRMISDLDRSETELKGALKDLQTTQAQLVQSTKMKALGELAASLVHEISQPLTVIRGLSHAMLRTQTDNSPQGEKMRLIGEAALRMEKIVKHLKSFSRSELPAFSPVDINNVVKDAFLILSEHLLAHSIETVLDLSPVPQAMGNPNRLEQVIINLVSNARDAMPGGGVLTVATRKEIDGDKTFVKIIIKDSGVGIPEEIVDKVFDPFFTTKETGKGTGLGLSISLSILREHKGDIRVESRTGQGSAFHVLLPAIGPG